MYFLQSLRRLGLHTLDTLRRFPLPVASALLACVLILLETHGIGRSQAIIRNQVYTRVALEALCGISLYTAFDLFCSARAAEFSKRLGLYLLGFCILGLHYYSINPAMLGADAIMLPRYLIFFACYHLLVSFSAFYQRNEIAAFWNYNYFLFLQFMRAAGFSLSLFVGIGSALWAVNNLFGMGFPDRMYIDLAAVLFIVFNTVFFLGGIPRDLNVFRREMDYRRSIRVFVQYVLMPVTLLYMGILYLYFFKVLMEQRIPNGWICIPILIFAILGVLTYLLIYPIREDQSQRLFYNYARYFFYSLLPLLTLYFMAIFQRINPYGITEDRYLIVVMGVWIFTMSIYIILSRLDNIIIIPVSLFTLLAISAMGPWGMFQLSGRNQLMRLEHILQRNALLQNKRLVKEPSRVIPEEEARSIQSILRYLKKRGELDRLYTWLNREDRRIVKDAIARGEMQDLNAMFHADVMPGNGEPLQVYTLHPVPRFFEYGLTSLPAASRLMHFSVNNGYPYQDSVTQVSLDEQNRLEVIYRNDTLLRANLTPLASRLIESGRKTDSLRLQGGGHVIRIFRDGYAEYAFPADSMHWAFPPATLLVNQVQAQAEGRLLRLETIDAYLMLNTDPTKP